MGENPDFRDHADAVPGVVGGVVSQVNEMAPDERRARLAEVAPEALADLEADDEDDEGPLPELPNAEAYDEVVMRAAPNPNGPWHLGSARMGAVLGTYREMYDGHLIVRFDDTDPETKRPSLDAYDAILRDLEYLGFEPDSVVRASDRLETYYEHARDLIEAGGAYACSCSQERFSGLKREAEACEHRDRSADETLAVFEDMVAGEYDPGEMVLRVRTDIEHKNPALRDWVAFRMIDTPHPRAAAADYRCWPMLDFQSGVDDHRTGVTHIVRGIDLQDSAKRQQFVYDYFDWEYPEVVHWGHVQVEEYDVPMSTSTILERVADGQLSGWDDPRAPTVASVRRRGIRGEALTNALVELGTSTSNVDLSMSAVYAENRDLVDDGADRLFLVRDPATRLSVVDGPAAGEPPVHPDHEERGRRRIAVDDAVLVEDDDLPADGERVWLKGYGPVRREDDRLVFTDDDIAVVRSGAVPVVHWVPADAVPVRLRTMDGDVTGHAEPTLTEYDEDALVQFERVGFGRVDAREPVAVDTSGDGADGDRQRVVVYYAHS
jgi:glutamyl-tRNA synthetase